MTKWEYMYAKAEDDKILEVNGEEVGAFQGVPIGGAARSGQTSASFSENQVGKAGRSSGFLPPMKALRAGVWF